MHQLPPTELHPPPPLIGTFRSKPKLKLTAYPCSCNWTKRLLQPLQPYPYNTPDDRSLLLMYCNWSQLLMILLLLLFHIKLIYLLNLSLLIISVVLSLFVIMSITLLNITHNWLGSLLRGKCLSVDYCVKWLLRKWSYIVEGAIIWSIASLPSSYKDEFLNLCWYCLGGGFFHLAYDLFQPKMSCSLSFSGM